MPIKKRCLALRILTGMAFFPFAVLALAACVCVFCVLAAIPATFVLGYSAACLAFWTVTLPLRMWRYAVTGKYPGGNEASALWIVFRFLRESESFDILKKTWNSFRDDVSKVMPVERR